MTWIKKSHPNQKIFDKMIKRLHWPETIKHKKCSSSNISIWWWGSWFTMASVREFLCLLYPFSGLSIHISGGKKMGNSHAQIDLPNKFTHIKLNVFYQHGGQGPSFISNSAATSAALQCFLWTLSSCEHFKYVEDLKSIIFFCKQAVKMKLTKQNNIIF